MTGIGCDGMVFMSAGIRIYSSWIRKKLGTWYLVVFETLSGSVAVLAYLTESELMQWMADRTFSSEAAGPMKLKLNMLDPTTDETTISSIDFQYG